MQLHAGRSADGVHWRSEAGAHPVAVQPDPEINAASYRYDPRVCWIEDRYYVTWCNGYHGPTIGVGYTHDFETFTSGERLPALQPQRRALPAAHQRQVRHVQPAQRQRPHPLRRHLLQRKPGHGSLGTPSLRDGRTRGGWQIHQDRRRADPIETREGWLLIYHGVLTSCNGFVYSFGAALLDSTSRGR
jgi:beta-1,4-mannooligosaccharide/beta-1,4-mannosyl-N-acetylglucosamine phosphorylase